MIAEKKVGLGTLGKGTTSYVTRSEHTCSLKGNCSVYNIGRGAFEEVELFHTNQVRTTQGKYHPASGQRCR